MRAIVAVVLVLTLTACGGGEKSAETAGTASRAPAALAVIDTPTLKSLLAAADPPLILDVRTPGEYSTGHIEPSVNIPDYALAERLGELEAHRGEPVVVLCERGGRSAKAARILSEAGFTVLDYSGGMNAWREQ